MLRYYFDTHIPKAAAVQLRERGVDVVRCEEVELADADDVEHLEYATAQHRTLVTHDRGFWKLHADWLIQGLHHAGIVLFNQHFQGNVGKLVTELFELYSMIEAEAGILERDIYDRVYEVER